ncbi:hypothetical protein HUJ04_010941 [Dendroctonus ponderosae]|nr:hypothetical protein HUJ04_010941 [Dendroctonus ponderosae]
MRLMAIAEVFLKLWGLWPTTSISPFRKIFYLHYKVVVIGWYTAFNCCYLVGSLRLIANNEPSERISKCLSVLLSIGLLLVKGLLYLKNHISQLCIKVTESEVTYSDSLDSKIKEAYKRTELGNNHLNYYILGSTFSTLIAYAGVSCIEVYNTGPDYWKMDNVSFMHEIYLPIDKLKWRWWIMVANIATACESVVVNIAVQSSYCALVMFGSLRLEVLRIRLKKFHKSSCNVADMKGFVIEHIDSIRNVSEFDAIKVVTLLEEGYSQREVARRLGVHHTTSGRYFRVSGKQVVMLDDQGKTDQDPQTMGAIVLYDCKL